MKPYDNGLPNHSLEEMLNTIAAKIGELINRRYGVYLFHGMWWLKEYQSTEHSFDVMLGHDTIAHQKLAEMLSMAQYAAKAHLKYTVESENVE